MKNIIMVIGILMFCNLLHAQNGTYRCNDQEFTDEYNPSRNKTRHNPMLVTIEINDVTGGSVLVTWLDDNTIYKWVVYRKIETIVTEKGAIYNNYDARFSFQNVQANQNCIVGIVEVPKTNTLHFVVFDRNTKTANWYHNLTKIN